MRRARVLLLLACVAAALAAADTAVWWWATGRMADEAVAWQAARVADGIAVLMGPPARGGWPWVAEVALPGVTVATDGVGQPGTLAWQSPLVRLTAPLWSPAAMEVAAEGPQTVHIGAAPPIAVTAARLHASSTGPGSAGGTLLVARDLQLALPAGPLSAATVSLRLRPEDAFLSATGVVLPARNLPFGGTVASVDAHLRSSGPLPRLADAAAMLAAWGAAHGRLLFDDLALRWGPLDARGTGSVGLDPSGQPEGTATVRLTGFNEVLDALARSGAITRSDARVAETLLGLLARPGAGQEAEAELPLTLRERTLLVGAIPLLRVPPLPVP